MNQSSKFCVKCGVNLQLAATSDTVNLGKQPDQYSQQSGGPTREEPNKQLQQAKQISKQYIAYFVQVLKSPTRTGQASDGSHMANGLITIVLFSLILPLIVYFQLRHRLSSFGGFVVNRIDFGSVVIKPFFFMLIILLLVNTVMFFVLKIGNENVNYREVTARFGSFMIPSVAFLLVALLFSLISDGSFIWGLSIGLGIFSWFVAVCLVIYSFKKDHTSGLDAFYGVIITYAASFILISLLGDDIASTLFRGLRGPF
ncbi:hypothetical protein ACFPOF_31225 [Cohnella soli]|uniref:YIP1 family protein n=2 Tax=Cohnella soli TaxID=425005 RepID=A0ABW0I3R6_9BACL